MSSTHKRWPYPISRAALASKVTKLRLEAGDIVVARDPSVMEALGHLDLKLPFNVPLVFAPQGIQVLKRADLLNLLEQLDSAATTPAAPDAATGVPL